MSHSRGAACPGARRRRRPRRTCRVGEIDEGPAIAAPPDTGVMPEGSRCGFVALAGRANVGQSTLMNRLVGEKVSIVSEEPQTTRFPVRRVLPRPALQIVFIDTAGIPKPRHRMNEEM